MGMETNTENRTIQRESRHGAIFLGDDEDAAFVVRRPFFLQPAPPRKGQSVRCEYKDEVLHEKV